MESECSPKKININCHGQFTQTPKKILSADYETSDFLNKFVRQNMELKKLLSTCIDKIYLRLRSKIRKTKGSNKF